MQNYKEFTITSKPFFAEVLQGILWELPISGIQEEENFIRLFCEDLVSVKKEKVAEILQKLVDEKIIESFQLSEKILQNRNWNEEWEKSRDVIVVSDKLVIKPSFKNYSANPNQIVLTIDPKMSFGTGEHQSTKLSLTFLEKYVKQSMKVLDVGTGTAVLAIAAIKLGAGKAVAIDNDEWCYDNSLENCKLNKVNKFIDVRLCELDSVEETDFDLIVANIQKDVLLKIRHELFDRIKNNGILILAGLLIEDEAEIRDEYEKLGFSILETETLGEWIAAAFQKSKR
jgi:ribosomal protein L11 methyltransferase